MTIHLSSSNCYVFVVAILSWISISSSIDTLRSSQSITSNQTLISALNGFQLGFFSPGNSNKFYLAIWFNIIPIRTVWIANRSNPLNDTSGVLRIGNDGNLILLDKTDRIVWSTGVQNLTSRITVAHLLDSGNLVLRDSKEEASILWQSFDHPTHALVPGMKLGWDLRTGLNRNLTSWKNSDDPSPGEYTHGFDLQGLPQFTIWRGSSKHFRTGPWNGIDFGLLEYHRNDRYITEATVNSEEVYYEHGVPNNSSLMMSEMSYSGTLQLFIRDNTRNDWRQLFDVPWESCGNYAYCGPNSVCATSDTRVCSCMIGYIPRVSQDWDDRIWAGGCIRENSFNCSQSGIFKEIDGLKMPDFFQFRVNTSMSMRECEAECSRNCSCTAYANSNATGAGHGCLLWFGDLIDVSVLPTPRSISQRLYIRVTAADLVSGSDSKNKRKIVIIVVTIAASTLLLLVVFFFIWKRKSLKEGLRQFSQVREDGNLEIPSFDIHTIARATQHFSFMNKIGEGGFGPVYKGKLSTGQEIAVKRLSEASHQGPIEFKNEVMLIAKLQHRNLVKLLGYCIHGEERMLIYEYMSNGSLDSYIFGASSSANDQMFKWTRRFAIIEGIARGLLYLQRDSRLTIIHRDLKASNVLLDSDMNPKISDFGLARTFAEEQLMVKTQRVVGTYGYMAPEYAIDGIYSMKSDVFSFGVLVLEMVSGKRNKQFRHPDHDFNLLGHAWKMWIDGKGSELIDPMMADSFPMHEVLRCIHVGLLCVQQGPEDRPTMSSVLVMLDSESAMPPLPKQPAYFTERVIEDSNPSSDEKNWTVNNLTNTVIKGR